MLPKEVGCLDLEVLEILVVSKIQHFECPADKQYYCKDFDSNIQVLQDPSEPHYSRQDKDLFRWLRSRVLHLQGMTLRQSTVGLQSDSEKRQQTHQC